MSGGSNPNYTISYQSGTLKVSDISTLQSISIAPGNLSLNVGETRSLSITGTYSDGSSRDLASLVHWNLSKPAVASVDATGTVTAATKGTTIMTASLNGIAEMTFLTVGKYDAAIPRVAGLSGPVSLLVSVKPDESGAMLSLAGRTGSVCILQASSDLLHWETLGTVTLSSESFSAKDPGVEGGTARFYRVLVTHLPAL